MTSPMPVPAPVPVFAIPLMRPPAMLMTMPSMNAPAKRRQKPARAAPRTPEFRLVSMASRMTVPSDGGRVVPRHLDSLQERRVILGEDVIPPRGTRIFERLRREEPEELPACRGIVGGAERRPVRL